VVLRGVQAVKRDAWISACGTFRWTLSRAWDDRPVLLVCMFGPSTADDSTDDPTITLVSHIASHNGYGGIVVVNGIPLRSSKPEPQFAMLDWDKRQEWSDRDRLQENLALVSGEASKAGAALIAWGALAGQTMAAADWFDNVREEIESALPPGAPLLCLGRTKAGYPLHPLARGKLKVRKDASLVPWERTRIAERAAA
jgi:hypothetical protein